MEDLNAFDLMPLPDLDVQPLHVAVDTTESSDVLSDGAPFVRTHEKVKVKELDLR